MARIINELTGRARGKVGNLIYKITNNKTSLSALPTSYRVSNTPEAIERRKRFRMTVKFANAVGKISPLKYFWKNVSLNAEDVHKSAFNKIVKESYSYVTGDALDADINIVPGFGFTAVSTETTLTNSLITLKIAAIGNEEKIDVLIETKVQAACLLFLKDPTDTRRAAYTFIECLSASTALNLSNPITFTFPIEGAERNLFDAYAVQKAYFTVLTLNDASVPIKFSDTIYST